MSKASEDFLRREHRKIFGDDVIETIPMRANDDHDEHQRLKDAVVAAAKDFSEQGGHCDWDIESVEAQRALLNAVEALLKFERENNL